MSRSFKRQPFQAICGNGSAKQDKRLAHRGERHAHKLALHITQDFENFILPHKFECAWNEVYSWGRDGNQRYCGLDAKDWDRYIKATTDPSSWWYGDEHYTVWPPFWYQNMMRK